MGFSRPLDFELEFNSRPHPFKVFEELELAMQTSSEKLRYSQWLVDAKSDSALAYYLFKNSNLSCSSKKAARACFLKFI